MENVSGLKQARILSPWVGQTQGWVLHVYQCFLSLQTSLWRYWRRWYDLMNSRGEGRQSVDESAVAIAPHHLGHYTGLFCLCGKCQGVIDISLYLCAMFQVLWSGFMLTFTSAPFSLAFFGALPENSSIGFHWGVFHLRQSSFPFPTRSPFDGSYYFGSQLFSVLFDLRFTADALSTEVWKIILILSSDRGNVPPLLTGIQREMYALY